MASNTKIGFLLGLAFIFVILFVISALSGSGGAEDDNDLSGVVVVEPIGIKPDISPGVLPSRRIIERHPEETVPPEDREPSPGRREEATSPGETGRHTQLVKHDWPKVHVVRKGDNLAEIAKKFYGRKEGNIRANIKRIFEANSKLLESPDEIYPGQKLIIPPLWASGSDKQSVEGIFPDSMFEKVDSIGRRNL